MEKPEIKKPHKWATRSLLIETDIDSPKILEFNRLADEIEEKVAQKQRGLFNM